jgi:hypothetical protein
MWRREPDRRPEPVSSGSARGATVRRFMSAALRVAWIYPAAVWVYLGVNFVTHPETVRLGVTHFSSWPTEGMAWITSFFLSMISHAGLQVIESEEEWVR